MFILLGIFVLYQEVKKVGPAEIESTQTTTVVTTTPQTSPYPSPVRRGERRGEVIDLENKVGVAWTKIATSSALKLYPNFSQKLSAVQTKKKYDCAEIISAGFYDKNNKPLGLFVSDGKTLNEERPNTFFNGYFSLNNNNVLEIEREAPDQNTRLALQSGPILWKNGQPLDLKIFDDKPARRIVLAITSDNKMVFLAFYDKNSDLEGPNLTEVPQLLSQFTQKTGINFDSALNLDGGSASAFYTNDISLSELTSVGGFFCIK